MTICVSKEHGHTMTNTRANCRNQLQLELCRAREHKDALALALADLLDRIDHWRIPSDHDADHAVVAKARVVLDAARAE